MFAGEAFVAEGRAGLTEEGRLVLAVEFTGEGLAEKIEGAGWGAGGAKWGAVGAGWCIVRVGWCIVDFRFAVVEGSDDDSIRGQGDVGEYFEAAFDPGVEIGLDAAFKF